MFGLVRNALHNTFQWTKPAFIQIRTATKRAAGSATNHGSSPGKRLGLKKFSDQEVHPGCIIVRQRGLKFHPGQHVGMGRDHTLYALTPGFVRFYSQRFRGKDRKYIGIVTKRGDVLPRNTAVLGRSRFFAASELTGNSEPDVDALRA